MSAKADPEIIAMERAWRLLEPFDTLTRLRMLSYLKERVGEVNRDELVTLLREHNARASNETVSD